MLDNSNSRITEVPGWLLFLHNNFMGWDRCVHVDRGYLEITAWHETDKTVYSHPLTTVPIKFEPSCSTSLSLKSPKSLIMNIIQLQSSQCSKTYNSLL